MPTVEYVAALVGCLAAGEAVVPVPPTASGPERAHIIRDSGAHRFVAGPDDEKYPGCRAMELAPPRRDPKEGAPVFSVR